MPVLREPGSKNPLMQNYALGTDERLTITGLLNSPRIQRAFQFINEIRDDLDAELIRICEIPAPPFKEEARARDIARRFEEIGLAHVHTDEEGNVIAERPGLALHPGIVVSAHLDTVFPEGTDVRVRRDGTRLHAPGISDTLAGL